MITYKSIAELSPRPFLGRVGALLNRLCRDGRGVAVIEFAMLAPIFIVLLCAILENGLILFTQSVLDNATRDASRQILLGTATSSTFSSTLCAETASIIPCASIKYSVQSGTSFSGLNASITTDASGNMTNTQFTPGSTSQAVLIQVSYNRPFMIPLYGVFSGVKSELLVSTVALKTEPF